MNLREALIVQSPSLELHRAAQAEIARLDAALRYAQTPAGATLRYEQPLSESMGEHAEGCWAWGPEHYECALRRIEAGR